MNDIFFFCIATLLSISTRKYTAIYDHRIITICCGISFSGSTSLTCLTNPSVTGGPRGIFQANSFVLIPSLNFTCSGNTTSLRWEVTQFGGDLNTPIRRIDLQIWRQTNSSGNNIDYTRLYNEMVIVTYSSTIFTITPTVTTTYESGDIVGFYIPTQGATRVVEVPFGSVEGHSYYYVTVSSPSSEESINPLNIMSRNRAPFLQSKLS